MTKYYVDEAGKYLGGYDGPNEGNPYEGIEVPEAPAHGLDIWNGSGWDAYVSPPVQEIGPIINYTGTDPALVGKKFSITFDDNGINLKDE